DPRLPCQFQLRFVFAVKSDFTARGLQHGSDQLREFTVAEYGRSGEIANGDLVQDLAGCGERLDKNSLFIGNVCRDEMQILQWQYKIFGEGSVVGHNSQNGAFGTVCFQATSAKFTNGFVIVGGAGNINFARDSFAQPVPSRFCRHACYFDYFANEFVPWNAAKPMIATENFDVGIANSRQAHANEGPARAQFRERSLRF